MLQRVTRAASMAVANSTGAVGHSEGFATALAEITLRRYDID
tara:strand:+ start:68 stop:193 length:126 start_codon:yes stop_codon:yes gene_type:complete